MKRRVFCYIVATLILSLGAVGAQATISSTFDSGDEGWTVFNDALPLVWHDNGGNPAGFISAQDTTAGLTWYFTAPLKFKGNLTSYIGGTLSYDIRLMAKSGYTDQNGYHDPWYYDYSINDNTTPIPEVIIANGTQVIRGNILPSPQPPLDTWTSYSIALLPANFGVDSTVFNAVLANVTALRIRGEYIVGGDTEGLDNVRLNAVSLPPFMLLLE